MLVFNCVVWAIIILRCIIIIFVLFFNSFSLPWIWSVCGKTMLTGLCGSCLSHFLRSDCVLYGFENSLRKQKPASNSLCVSSSFCRQKPIWSHINRALIDEKRKSLCCCGGHLVAVFILFYKIMWNKMWWISVYTRLTGHYVYWILFFCW